MKLEMIKMIGSMMLSKLPASEIRGWLLDGTARLKNHFKTSTNKFDDLLIPVVEKVEAVFKSDEEEDE